MQVAKPGGRLLTVTERGYAKQTELGEYRVTGRGGLGHQERRDHRQERAGREHRCSSRTATSCWSSPNRARSCARRATISAPPAGPRRAFASWISSAGDRVVSVALVAKTEEEVIDDTGVEPDGPSRRRASPAPGSRRPEEATVPRAKVEDRRHKAEQWRTLMVRGATRFTLLLLPRGSARDRLLAAARAADAQPVLPCGPQRATTPRPR